MTIEKWKEKGEELGLLIDDSFFKRESRIVIDYKIRTFWGKEYKRIQIDFKKIQWYMDIKIHIDEKVKRYFKKKKIKNFILEFCIWYAYELGVRSIEINDSLKWESYTRGMDKFVDFPNGSYVRNWKEYEDELEFSWKRDHYVFQEHKAWVLDQITFRKKIRDFFAACEKKYGKEVKFLDPADVWIYYIFGENEFFTMGYIEENEKYFFSDVMDEEDTLFSSGEELYQYIKVWFEKKKATARMERLFK